MEFIIIFKREVLLITFISLFFAIDFIRELLIYIHPNIINVLSISFGLIIIYLFKNIKISKKIKTIYYFIILFIILSILNGVIKGFIDNNTIIYSFYKLIEITIILIIASNLTKEQLLKFYKKFIYIFFALHSIIFTYYLLVLVGILPFYNRIVVFDYRFGGLSGEPAQYGQMILVVLFMIFALNKYSYIKNFKFKLLIFAIYSFTSFSNAFFLSFIIFIMYFYLKQKASLFKLIGYYFTVFLIIGLLFLINERLNIDFEKLWFIVINFQELANISAEGVGLNSITIRFFEVLKSLSMANELIGNGLGSSANYPIFTGQLEEGQRINFYGISQIGYELGLIPMVLLLVWFIKQIKYSIIDLFNKSAIITIFFIMIAINGLSFKLYWFMLFILILNTIEKEKYETLNNSQ